MPTFKTPSLCRWALAAVTTLFFTGALLYASSDDSVEKRVDSLLSQMTLDEKIVLLGGDQGDFSTMAIPRLGIPKFIMADGPQGVRNYGKACLFPSGVALAATWDGELAKRYGRGIALEARARGVHIILGPGVNISRLPVNGRNFEYFGEDPFLASIVASQWVKGMQNEGVIATIKHFAANNQETWRGAVDVRMDDRTLHEIYLPAFRRAVQENHVWAVMSAYNRFDGDFCCGSNLLQNKILKNELGFQGLVMSDWGACHALSDLAAGLDLEMPRAQNIRATPIREAMKEGKIEPQQIDGAVRRLLRATISMGFWDRVQKRDDLPLDSPDSCETARTVARGAIVLLKNDNATLPLDRARTHKIAVYGPNAFNTPVGGGGSGSVDTFHAISFLDGIRAQSGSNIKIIGVHNPPEPSREEADPFPLVRTAADGPVGFKATITTHDPEATIPLPVQSGINVTWKTGELPFGVQAARADYDFSGVLVAEEDGAWEIFGNAEAWIRPNGIPERLVTGDLIHLKKGEPFPFTVRFYVNKASVPEPSGSSYQWMTLRKPQLPDLTEAKNADAVIVCAGLNSNQDSEAIDRNFDMPETQSALIRALAEVNPRVIVTVNSGAAVGMTEWINQVPALLETWYLGQEGGTALGEVLFGDVNPSGHLPSTFGRAFADYPSVANFPGRWEAGSSVPVVRYDEGIFVGYRGFDKAGKEPLFPFGYGLSYTTFDYSDLKVSPAQDGSVQVTLKVKNSGKRAGSEVVQIYVGEPKCSVPRPVRELKGFAKVSLHPGETKTVNIALPQESFAYWNSDKSAWTVEPGLFTIEAGQSSRNIRLKSTLKIAQPATLASRATATK
jgi:beta-glucosidase